MLDKKLAYFVVTRINYVLFLSVYSVIINKTSEKFRLVSAEHLLQTLTSTILTILLLVEFYENI